MAESRLERLRRHRILMEIAVTERLSLGDARTELLRRHEEMRQRGRRSVRLETPVDTPIAADEPAQTQFWWQRD